MNNTCLKLSSFFLVHRQIIEMLSCYNFILSLDFYSEHHDIKIYGFINHYAAHINDDNARWFINLLIRN